MVKKTTLLWSTLLCLRLCSRAIGVVCGLLAMYTAVPATRSGSFLAMSATNLTAGMALIRRRSQTRRRPVFQVDMMRNIAPAMSSGNQPPWGIFNKLATARGPSTISMPPATSEA